MCVLLKETFIHYLIYLTQSIESQQTFKISIQNNIGGEKNPHSFPESKNTDHFKIKLLL